MGACEGLTCINLLKVPRGSCHRTLLFFPVFGIESDVAGATFMAAGSSAPELATTVIGVFICEVNNFTNDQNHTKTDLNICVFIMYFEVWFCPMWD